MRGLRRTLLAAGFATVVAVSINAFASLGSASAQGVGLPAKVVTFTPTKPADRRTVETKPTAQYGPTGSGTALRTTWREVDGLGNGAEKFLTTDQHGTIYDLGGRYLNFSRNGGTKWLSVQPQTPLINAEGAVAAAPNGDIIGVTWDPYGGDLLYSYKYDAASHQWLYLNNPLHTPFYDRPEVDVIPGPLTVPAPGGGTQVVPYISMVSSHGSPIFYSTDGLSYENAIGQDNQLQIGAPLKEWIPTKRNRSLDWDQTQTWSPMRALGAGWALDFPGAAPVEDYSPADIETTSKLLLFDPHDLNLHPLTLPNGTKSMSTDLQVDSLGRIHRITIHKDKRGFDYQVSRNGGKTWSTLSVEFPRYTTLNTCTGGLVEDLRVNAKLGIAALIVRLNVGSAKSPPRDESSPQQDYVYKIKISGARPVLYRRYLVGDGNTTEDQAYLGTYETGGHRYDFATIAILPDGRVATSFMDEASRMPFPTTGNMIEASGVAIERSSHRVSAGHSHPRHHRLAHHHHHAHHHHRLAHRAHRRRGFTG